LVFELSNSREPKKLVQVLAVLFFLMGFLTNIGLKLSWVFINLFAMILTNSVVESELYHRQKKYPEA